MRIESVLAFLMLIPQAKSETQSHAPAKIFELAGTGADIRIPSAIWTQIGGVEGKDNVTFAPLKVRLVQKTAGTLIEPEIEIRLPRGGGTIDLSQFVRGESGTFRVYFEFEDDLNPETFRAYFVSRARQRKIDGEVWGAGCRKYMAIENFILKEASKKGLEVNVTRNRHDTVLGGSFIFAVAQRQVTQVTFTDSHQPQLFCGTSEEK